MLRNNKHVQGIHIGNKMFLTQYAFNTSGILYGYKCHRK